MIDTAMAAGTSDKKAQDVDIPGVMAGAAETGPDSASLDELLARASAEHEVVFEPVSAGGLTLWVLQIADMSAYIERLERRSGEGPLTLPFWAKIWPSSLLLAHILPQLSPSPERGVLEIGAGVGVCGLFAAALGFRTTITDISPEAVLFARINILKNGLADRAEARVLDFAAGAQAPLNRRFDLIIGSEVLYLEHLARPLVKFLLKHLSHDPSAEALLSRDYTRQADAFLSLAARDFRVMEKTVGCKETSGPGDEKKIERHLCQILRLKAKKHA